MLILYCQHFFKDCTVANWKERVIFIILTTDEIESISIIDLVNEKPVVYVTSYKLFLRLIQGPDTSSVQRVNQTYFSLHFVHLLKLYKFLFIPVILSMLCDLFSEQGLTELRNSLKITS